MKCHHFTVVTREFGALYRYEVKYSQSEAIWRLSQCLHYEACAIMSTAVGKIHVIKYFGNLNFRFGVSQNVHVTEDFFSGIH